MKARYANSQNNKFQHDYPIIIFACIINLINTIKILYVFGAKIDLEHHILVLKILVGKYIPRTIKKYSLFVVIGIVEHFSSFNTAQWPEWKNCVFGSCVTLNKHKDKYKPNTSNRFQYCVCDFVEIIIICANFNWRTHRCVMSCPRTCAPSFH